MIMLFQANSQLYVMFFQRLLRTCHIHIEIQHDQTEFTSPIYNFPPSTEWKTLIIFTKRYLILNILKPLDDLLPDHAYRLYNIAYIESKFDEDSESVLDLAKFSRYIILFFDQFDRGLSNENGPVVWNRLEMVLFILEPILR